MIKIDNLYKKFWTKEVLHGLNIELKNGVYGLLGPNGSGKTTLIRCMLNIYQPNDGAVLYDDINIMDDESVLNKIGYLPQKYGMFKELTVRQCLAYFADMKNVPRENITAEVERCLEKLNLLDRIDSKVRTLSGGMVRRLGIAQAILGDPKIIIVDEPTAGLDPEERLRFKNVINEIRKDKIILISTHIVDDIDALCDKIIIMKDGNIAFSGDSSQLKILAYDHIYEITEEQFANSGNLNIIARYERDGNIYYKGIGKDIIGRKLSPDLESAYMCVLKDIL